MTDLGSRLKQTIQDQSLNLKFMELLNSNRQMQSIKDRQILPSIPLSSFNPTGLPSIHKQKLGMKAKSMSQNKIKYNKDKIMDSDKDKDYSKDGDRKNNRKQSQYLISSQKIQLGSMKNLKSLRNRSLESAHKSRKSVQKPKQKPLTPTKMQIVQEQNMFIAISSQKSVIQIQQMQTQITQITPHKIRLDLPSNTSNTKNTKLLTSNKTIQQISNQAVDSLMLNLKFGKIQENLSYKSFLKKQGQPTPLECVKKLQEWANKYKIKSGIIYTKNLQNIFNRKSIANHMILAQFANYTQVRREVEGKMEGLQFYPQIQPQKGKQKAATKIQSLFRMNFQIKYTQKLKSLMNKVRLIQRYWRVSLAYRKGHQQIMNRVTLKIQRVKTLTNNLIKNWDIIKTSPRVEIHICSIALQQFKRLSMTELQYRQLAQLTRIFKAAQTDCTIIYVTPLSFPGQIVRYYERIFSFGNKSSSFRQRLYFITIQKMLQRISGNLTTVSALVYDSQNLNKIRQIIKNKQQPVMGQTSAFIIPSYPSSQYTNLAAELQIPIFSGSQSLCKLYSTKSGHYQLLKPFAQSLGQKTPFLFPKTIHGIYSQKQLITTLAVLIHKNKQIKKWLLKIDDEVNTRGLAILNVDSLAFLKQLRKQNENQEEIIEDKQMIRIIADQLKAKLKLRLKILHKNVYPDYSTYMSHFLTRGGFIQQCIEPQLNQGKLNKPIQHSISFKIQPNGQFQILTTYSRLQLGYKSLSSAIQFPSNLTPQQIDNQKIIRSLYRHLWLKLKLFGYFTIDLLYTGPKKDYSKSSQKQKQNKGKIYVIGLDCFLNEKTSSIYVPTLTSLCQFDKQKNKYHMKQSLQNQSKKVQQTQTQKSYTTQRSITQMSEYPTQQNTIIQKPKQINKQISFFYCPLIKLYNLPSIAQFFKMCKFANISFDIQTKTGTLFLLQGGLQNGCLGFICAKQTINGMHEQTLKLVQFLSKQFRDKNKKQQKQGRNKQGSDQIGQIRGYLLNCLRKTNANINNQKKQYLNLQMIF